MPTYTFYIISNAVLSYNSGTEAFDFDASYEHWEDRYRVDVVDDDASMNATGDGNQTAMIYDMDGNLINSGLITVPQFAEIELPGDGVGYLDRIEIDGTHYGYLPSTNLTPGASYPVEDSASTDMDHAYFENQSVPCFGPDTQIDTTKGPRAITSLKVGDRVLTYDNGPQPIVWIGSRQISRMQALANLKYRPVVYAGGIRGIDVPIRPLTLSQQHRVMVDDALVHLFTHSDQVFVRAGDLGKLSMPAKPVEWCHFALPHHEVVRANGVWVESLFAGDALANLLNEDQCAQIKQATRLKPHLTTARMCLRKFEAAALIDRLRTTDCPAQSRNKRVA